MAGAALLLLMIAAERGELTAPHPASRFAVVVNAPSGRPGKLAPSDILREVSDQLRAHTDFDLVEIDASVVKKCGGKLACMVLDVRNEYGEAELPTFLMVATHLTHEQLTERLSVLLIDTARAIRILDDADREDADFEQRAETQILASMIPEQGIDITRPDDALGFLGDLIQNDYKSAFEKSGHWHPFGSIELTVPEGAVVMLDEVQLGVAQDGVTRIQRVAGGAHQLRVESSGYEPYTASVQVERDRIATVPIELVRHIDVGRSALRQTVLWTGVVAAAAGAALVIYSVAKPNDLHGYCVHTAEVECGGGATFVRFGDGGDPPFESGNGRGPPVAPLGIGLLGLGATWSIGTWLFGEEDDIPWIQGLVGLGVLGVTLGLTLALEGDDPVRQYSAGIRPSDPR